MKEEAAVHAVVGDRLNDSTLEKVCRNAASTWAQSGHLEGRTFKKRRVVLPSSAAAAFAIYLAHAAGFRGGDIFSCAWLRVLDCDPSRARHLALEAKRIGLLDLRMAGDVVDLNLARLDPCSGKGMTMARIEDLAERFGRHIATPWQRTIAGAQRVVIVVYDKELERTLRARKLAFETATREAGRRVVRSRRFGRFRGVDGG